jgi:hypothetical protein
MELAKLQTHTSLPQNQRWLTNVDHLVEVPDIRIVIDYLFVCLDPGVRSKWGLLNTQDHARWDSRAPEQTGRGGGALEAKHFFPVPDRGKINRMAYLFDSICIDQSTARKSPDCLIETREIAAHEKTVKANQRQIRSGK